ncbi:MAG: NAD(P)-dependent glycerol-3-phosphate dehydrogenase [Saprospiraceae bacterium]|nr:NAD(P)-dependent glycerol-3-phosphate dehydrogenase [Saprospiraceae bacterium]
MKPVGVIGAGSFGITVAQLLSENVDVLLFSRKAELVTHINNKHTHLGYHLSKKITAANDLKFICRSCDVIFLVVPSGAMRTTVQAMSNYLRPFHIIIHGTKGLDTSLIKDTDLEQGHFDIRQVCTMSEVIAQESTVLRIGCMAGPNLAREILNNLPAASVIASEFDEVIKTGKALLTSKRFTVFGSYDLKGAEISGSYKNIIALASGIVNGLGLGKNMEALLITRGLSEMIEYGTSMGLSGQAFFGAAGLGDLIATSTSEKSRNFAFGYRFAKGESTEDIIKSSPEVVEGVRTLKIIYFLAKYHQIPLPITNLLYKVIYENFDVIKAIDILMSIPNAPDVDFNIVR